MGKREIISKVENVVAAAVDTSGRLRPDRPDLKAIGEVAERGVHTIASFGRGVLAALEGKPED